MEIPDKDLPLQREGHGEKSEVREWLREFLDVDKVNPKILKRLELLNHLTHFVEEERESIQYAKKLADYCLNNRPDEAFTKDELDIAIIGLILADIGKTGPMSATEPQQALIARLFGIEGVRDVKKPIRDFIRERFSDTAQQDLDLFEAMGLDPSMPIENFWRLHSGWTLGIIEGDGVPEEDLPGAALHHVLEGDNIDLIDGEGNYKPLVTPGGVKLRFGKNRRFDRPEKLVVLLDKYFAFLKRIKGMTHEGAINELRGMLSRNQRYSADTQFLELIDDLDKAFG